MLLRYVLEKNAVNQIHGRLKESNSKVLVDLLYGEALMFSIKQFKTVVEFEDFLAYISGIYACTVSQLDNEMCRFSDLDSRDHEMYIGFAATICFKERRLLSALFDGMDLTNNFKIKLRYQMYVLNLLKNDFG